LKKPERIKNPKRQSQNKKRENIQFRASNKNYKNFYSIISVKRAGGKTSELSPA
jgi:hypothetical protein